MVHKKPPSAFFLFKEEENALKNMTISQMALTKRWRRHKNQISHSNSGLKSLIYYSCALTCYYLRKNNISDPADIYDLKEFDKYLKEIVTLELKRNFILREKIIFSKEYFNNLSPNLINNIIKLFYKYFNKFFSLINNYRIVGIAIKIAKNYKKPIK